MCGEIAEKPDETFKKIWKSSENSLNCSEM